MQWRKSGKSAGYAGEEEVLGREWKGAGRRGRGKAGAGMKKGAIGTCTVVRRGKFSALPSGVSGHGGAGSGGPCARAKVWVRTSGVPHTAQVCTPACGVCRWK